MKCCLFHIGVEAKPVFVHIKSFTAISGRGSFLFLININTGLRLCPSVKFWPHSVFEFDASALTAWILPQCPKRSHSLTPPPDPHQTHCVFNSARKWTLTKFFWGVISGQVGLRSICSSGLRFCRAWIICKHSRTTVSQQPSSGRHSRSACSLAAIKSKKEKQAAWKSHKLVLCNLLLRTALKRWVITMSTNTLVITL